MQLTLLQTNTYKWTMHFLDTELKNQLSGINVASFLKFQQNQYSINEQLGFEWPLPQRALTKRYLTNNITTYPINTNLILLRANNTKLCGQFFKFQNVKCRTYGINQLSLRKKFKCYLSALNSSCNPIR